MAQVNSGHRVCVVMPTYNERDNLEPTLTDLFLRNAGVDVLIDRGEWVILRKHVVAGERVEQG